MTCSKFRTIPISASVTASKSKGGGGTDKASVLFIFPFGVPSFGDMGAFTDLFGYIPRVQVLEVFAENSGDSLSAPDVEKIADVSRRAAYLIIRRYVKDGVIVPVGASNEKPRRFQLNPNDLRSQTLWGMEHILTLGGLQAEIKRARRLPFTQSLPYGVVSRIPRIQFVVDWTSMTSSNRVGWVTSSEVLGIPGGKPRTHNALSTSALEGLTQVMLPYTEPPASPSGGTE